MALTHLRASSSPPFSQCYTSRKTTLPSRPGNTLHRSAQAKPWQVGGNYPDNPTNKPGHAFTWHTKLSICFQWSPLQKLREQRDARAAQGTRIFRVLWYISSPLLNVVRSNNAHLNMEQNQLADLFWGWPSALLNSQGVYSALTFTCTKSHGQSPFMKPLMWRHLYCSLIASCCGICTLHSQIWNPVINYKVP